MLIDQHKQSSEREIAGQTLIQPQQQQQQQFLAHLFSFPHFFNRFLSLEFISPSLYKTWVLFSFLSVHSRKDLFLCRSFQKLSYFSLPFFSNTVCLFLYNFLLIYIPPTLLFHPLFYLPQHFFIPSLFFSIFFFFFIIPFSSSFLFSSFGPFPSFFPFLFSFNRTLLRELLFTFVWGTNRRRNSRSQTINSCQMLSLSFLMILFLFKQVFSSLSLNHSFFLSI
ncbi:unnamed protein product [Acanthosepion pharaonis]|uniref:Uncharacterized protein n=1 Tax=Acanthosepion pharaonis TaxID=158019 RepID=A0A812DZF2_ACAPH|nr:unnamed protein product [Sepia pharaonis]